MSGMLVYEVDLAVDAEIADAFRAWLPGHVAELLALPGFVSAEILAVEDPPPAAGTVGWCVQYRLRDRGALDAYLRDHAARLRAEGVDRFGGAFSRQQAGAGRSRDARAAGLNGPAGPRPPRRASDFARPRGLTRSSTAVGPGTVVHSSGTDLLHAPLTCLDGRA